MILAKESASDLVQSACREVLQDLGGRSFPSDGLLRHWLYLAAERKILDRARFHRRARRDAALEAPAAYDEQAHAILECHRGAASPSEAASAHEELARMEEAMLRLPEESREIIMLSRIVGLTNAEIAEKLGKTEGAVRTTISRALARLAVMLESGR